MNRNLNSTNNTVSNQITNNRSRNNLVTPEILVNQLWMQEELRDKSVQQESLVSSGVKIIELNTSSESSKGSPVNYSHAWSYVNNDHFKQMEQDEYRVNVEARRRRRMKINQYEEDLSTVYEDQCCYDRDTQSNSNAFYDNYDSDISCTPMNHQMNCFTILNNRQAKSDSSTDNENYEAIEIIDIDNEKKYWDHVYNEQVVTYDPRTQTEKRTIWIYSYKNKHLLSDNEFELVNIPCKDNSSSSTSISDEEKKVDKSTNASRIGSPVPATCIPRLDLSLVQTLSTVTEISEPNKQSKESSHETINLKPRNNWFSDRNEKERKPENSSIINWMALSPRERRRRSINTNLEITSKVSVKETEVTHAEGATQLDQVSIKSNKVDLSTVEVQADIHTNGYETYKDADTCTSSNEEPEPVKTKKIADLFPMEISYADADIDVDNNRELDFANRPSIKISNIVNKKDITDPIEKLENSNWISEERDEEEAMTYDYDLENATEINTIDSGSGNVDFDTPSKRLWRNNMQLMKPPQWAEYLPITCSPPSIHLTLSISSINEKKSWLRRLIKCLKCCK